jgi:hypothetical protein
MKFIHEKIKINELNFHSVMLKKLQQKRTPRNEQNRG